MPTLAEVVTSWPFTWYPAPSAVQTRRASRMASSGVSSSSATMANSSPPSRPTRSTSRTFSFSLAATSSSSAVARGVAERVVDVLEAIEVEAEYRHEVAVALGAGHSTFEVLIELYAVRQAGQRIVHGEESDLVLGVPALADAPRGDRRRHGEAHDDQKAGGQGDDRERHIGQRGGRGLVNGKGVDAGELAAFHDGNERKADIPLAGQVGKLDTAFARCAGKRLLDVAFTQHGVERFGGEVAADGESGALRRQNGEAVEATDELAFCLVDIAQQPAAGNLVETIDQVESVRAETWIGGKRDVCAGVLGEIAKARLVQHVHVLVEHALRCAGLAQTVVDVTSPGQCGFARVAAEHVIDRRSARQDAGNDSEKTQDHQTGHYQPIPTANFCHLREFP